MKLEFLLDSWARCLHLHEERRHGLSIIDTFETSLLSLSELIFCYLYELNFHSFSGLWDTLEPLKIVWIWFSYLKCWLSWLKCLLMLDKFIKKDNKCSWIYNIISIFVNKWTLSLTQSHKTNLSFGVCTNLYTINWPYL